MSKMPAFSHNLEQSLARAIRLASERHHKSAMPEHLLLALVDDPDAAEVMRACNVDLDKLRDGLVTHLQSESLNDSVGISQPSDGFQRVIQRAVIHVQSSNREEVTGANALVAIFAERESHAAFFLQEQKMTRYDAVSFISYGIAKKSDEKPGMARMNNEYSKLNEFECRALNKAYANEITQWGFAENHQIEALRKLTIRILEIQAERERNKKIA